ncbi:peptidase M48 Ste24p [Calothrix sp. NIES-2100]|uniref:M48 family metallopeptidase n=1 Tax=Calothrix sp. NIES-2100 TaxID=1954172 RepID=UPI000B6040D4|nr:peptidase M48 Ste24p [Calothrix sp. NIES-2100]
MICRSASIALTTLLSLPVSGLISQLSINPVAAQTNRCTLLQQRCKEVTNIPIQTSPKKSKSRPLAQAQVKNWAWVYSVMEKVIRANELDEHTWRVRVVNQYIDNAFASDVNLVTVYDGLLDKINGDDAALAFIIGHELAHNSQRHLAVSATVNAEVLQRLNNEAETEIQKLVADEQQKFQQQGEVRGGVEIACVILGSFCRKVPIQAGAYLYLNSQGQPDPNRIEQQKQQIIAQKQQEFNKQQIQLGRRQESEADEFGYLYMVKAGYDPKGAFRAMEILARIPVPNPSIDVHPPATERIEALQTLTRKVSSPALVAEGAAKLRKTKPLTYAASSDGQSLLINSRFGSK